MDKITVSAESVQWALESLANQAYDSRDPEMALHAIRLFDSLKAFGYGSAVESILEDLAVIAHVDLRRN